MYNITHAMHIVKSDETLFCQGFDQGDWHSLVVVALDDLKEVDSEDLKDHDKVLAVGTVVDEGIEQLAAVGHVTRDTLGQISLFDIAFVVLADRALPLGSLPIGSDLVQDFDLVVSRF